MVCVHPLTTIVVWGGDGGCRGTGRKGGYKAGGIGNVEIGGVGSLGVGGDGGGEGVVTTSTGPTLTPRTS